MQPTRKRKSLALIVSAVLLFSVLAVAGLSVARSEPEASAAACAVYISEVQASNGIIPDTDGVLRDWVELYNGSSRPYNLSGCGLSDDALNIKYFFPEGTVIPAEGRLVVFCESSGANHAAPFGIGRTGRERICFFTADDMLADSVELPLLGKGEVYARTEQGFEVLGFATPGYENTSTGYGRWLAARGQADCPVVLSELMAANRCTLPGPDDSFPDWIELYNTGKKDFSLTGWWLGQESASPDWVFPEMTLAAGERVVLLCDGVNGPDFSLAASGETLCLFAPDGTPAWEHSWAKLEDDRSFQLEENGEYRSDGEPSPGQPNTAEGVLAAQIAADRADGLLISELQTNNSRFYQQRDGEYYDWIEFYNSSEDAILLSDYRISTKVGYEEAWTLPAVTLESGDYYILICSGDESLNSLYFTHAPFRLGATGERLYLYGADGGLRDFCYVNDVPLEGSFGRMAGEKGWYRFTVPTPEKPNQNGVRRAAEKPETLLSPGVYEGVESLEVALSAPGEIYYTLDGSHPTKNSPLYRKPLRITETTVLRAINTEDGCLPSEAATFSYILNEGHSLPVVSLAVDPRELASIYNIPNSVGDDTEILGYMTFFDENGIGEGACGVAVHGATSRDIRMKKSLKMTFRPRYGGHLRYDVFGDGECSDYFSLVIRSGYMKDNTLLCDEICAAVALQSSDNVLGLRSRYCAAYINGEYAGVYALRDAYSDTYVSNALDTREDGVFISRAPVRFSRHPELMKFYEFLKQQWSAEEKFQRIADEFDLVSLADWMILQAYFTNNDIPGNIRYIRGAEDQPWKMAFFDLDFGLRWDVSWWYVLDGVNEFGHMTRAAAASPEFQDLLFRRMAALFEAGLNEETCLAWLDQFSEELGPELEREYKRWEEGRGDLEESRTELQRIIESNRQNRLVDHFCELMELDAEAVRAEYFGGMELE